MYPPEFMYQNLNRQFSFKWRFFTGEIVNFSLSTGNQVGNKPQEWVKVQIYPDIQTVNFVHNTDWICPTKFWNLQMLIVVIIFDIQVLLSLQLFYLVYSWHQVLNP